MMIDIAGPHLALRLPLKEGLENHANNLVIVSATIATVLFGFVAFSYTNIERDNQYFYWILGTSATWC
jgi:hypothetical protein